MSLNPILTKHNAIFGVFHDIPKASPIKIHNANCSQYKRHDPLAPTTNWCYANNLTSANEIARRIAIENNMQYRDCKFCKPNFLSNN